jgi:hypothetical protein
MPGRQRIERTGVPLQCGGWRNDAAKWWRQAIESCKYAECSESQPAARRRAPLCCNAVNHFPVNGIYCIAPSRFFIVLRLRAGA